MDRHWQGSGGVRWRGVLALLAILALGGIAGLLPSRAASAAGQEQIVVARGTNAFGVLGDGTTTNRPNPVLTHGPRDTTTLRNVVALSAGGIHSLALRADGTVLTWGTLLALNTHAYVPKVTLPTFVPGLGGGDTLGGVTAVAAGEAHSLALRADGTVVAWGDNRRGQLGDGTTDERLIPVVVKGVGGAGVLNNVRALAADYQLSVALRADGSVVAWGANEHGQLGDGSATDRRTPVVVRGVDGDGTLGGIVAVAAGNAHIVALRADGTVVAWGSHGVGQLGNDAPIGDPRSDSPNPVEVKGIGSGLLRDVTAIDASGTHTLALRRDGSVVAWGGNSSGELGNGGFGGNRNVPGEVKDVAGTGHLGNILAIAAGSDHNLALRGDGTVVTWGQKNIGEFDFRPEAANTRPVPLLGVGGGAPIAGVSAISAGGNVDLLLVAAPRPAPCGRFADVLTGDPACAAIEGLAARGIVRGCDQAASPPLFCPDDPTARAQMAALIARAMGWEAENHGNQFADRCLPSGGCIDDALWRNVGTLQYYGVAKGYPDGTYNPFDSVLKAQTISFVTRGLVKKGTWTAATQDRPRVYGNVPLGSGHRLDLVTYVTVAGAVPGTTSTTQDFKDWDSPALRGWFAEALWQAVK